MVEFSADFCGMLDRNCGRCDWWCCEGWKVGRCAGGRWWRGEVVPRCIWRKRKMENH